jgi:hypothetical protein
VLLVGTTPAFTAVEPAANSTRRVYVSNEDQRIRITIAIPGKGTLQGKWALYLDGVATEQMLGCGELTPKGTVKSIEHSGLSDGPHHVMLVLRNASDDVVGIETAKVTVSTKKALVPDALVGVLVGGAIGMASSLCALYVQERFQLRRTRRLQASNPFGILYAFIEELGRSWNSVSRDMEFPPGLSVVDLGGVLGSVRKPEILVRCVQDVRRIHRMWREGNATEGQKDRLDQLRASLAKWFGRQ